MSAVRYRPSLPFLFRTISLRGAIEGNGTQGARGGARSITGRHSRDAFLSFDLRAETRPAVRAEQQTPRGEGRVDTAGVAVRAEGRSPEGRAERISGEASAG